MCYMRCRHCTMVYANPVPETFVTGQFYQDRTQDFYLSATKLTADYDPVRFQREWRLFRSWVSSGRVLDVGCSTGGFLRGLIPLGFEVLAAASDGDSDSPEDVFSDEDIFQEC